MSKPIELTTFDDPTAMHELAVSTWANSEPGFQIDGVDTVEKLLEVFTQIRQAAPSEESRNVQFRHVYPTNTDFDKMHDRDQPLFDSEHTDGESPGMAVHQNISDTIDVKLGVATPKYRNGPMKWPKVRNRRNGETIPGRLTVFSEGGYDWLLPTSHQFRRPSGLGNEWVRYVQKKEAQTIYINGKSVEVDLILDIAKSALSRIAIKSKQV